MKFIKTQNHFVLSDKREKSKKKKSKHFRPMLGTVSIVPVTPRRRQNFAFVFRVKKKEVKR